MNKSTLIVMLFLIPVLGLTGKDIRLSYKLEKGQSFTLEIINRQTINMSMMGQSMSLNQNAKVIQLVEVADKSSEAYTLSIKYDHIVFKQNAMGMELQYDSKKSDDSNPLTAQLAENFRKTLENTITTTIDHRGMPISNNAREMGGYNNLSGFESGLMVVYPDRSIKVGESWDVQLKPDPQSDFVINSTYKLESAKGNIAKISYNGSISGTEIMGSSAKVSGSLSGNMEVNINSGWLVKGNMTQDVEMEMEENGTKIPMRLSVLTEISSK